MVAIDVDRVLGILDEQVPAGASVSWFGTDAPAPPALPSRAAAGAAGATTTGAGAQHRAPSPPVVQLLTGLGQVLADVGGEFAAGGTDLLVETPTRTVLVHHVDGTGSLVVEAGKGLNLALVRRLVTNALEAAGGTPLPAEPVVRLADRATRTPGTDDAAGSSRASAFPRRTPQQPVTDFGYVPEDAEVLRMLEQALSG